MLWKRKKEKLVENLYGGTLDKNYKVIKIINLSSFKLRKKNYFQGEEGIKKKIRSSEGIKMLKIFYLIQF